jgi:hypothetical protein
MHPMVGGFVVRVSIRSVSSVRRTPNYAMIEEGYTQLERCRVEKHLCVHFQHELSFWSFMIGR